MCSDCRAEHGAQEGSDAGILAATRGKGAGILPPGRARAARRARPLTGLLALLCPLLCLGPIALASIAGTGMVRSLGGAPWALGAASIAAAVALCACGMRPGHAQRRHDGESVPCPWASE